MKRIIIICEGPTEQEFCKNVLQPHFNTKKIYLHCPLIKKSGGGIVAWHFSKKQAENHLVQENDAHVTTFIDYYGIHPGHRFPGWEASNQIIDKNTKMDLLESSMRDAITTNLKNRFIPYMQLHEFEGLLFTDIAAFDINIPQQDFVNKSELEQTIINYPNPELINDTPQNAPSYRLSRLIKGYKKIVYGAILAESIGLHKIRRKNPRFNSWITKLEGINDPT